MIHNDASGHPLAVRGIYGAPSSPQRFRECPDGCGRRRSSRSSGVGAYRLPDRHPAGPAGFPVRYWKSVHTRHPKITQACLFHCQWLSRGTRRGRALLNRRAMFREDRRGNAQCECFHNRGLVQRAPWTGSKRSLTPPGGSSSRRRSSLACVSQSVALGLGNRSHRRNRAQ